MKFFFKKCTNVKQKNLADLPRYILLITYGWPFWYICQVSVLLACIYPIWYR